MSFLSEMFYGDGKVSSKRVLAFMGFIAAGVLLWYERDTGGDSMLIFSASCLGISGVEKFKDAFGGVKK